MSHEWKNNKSILKSSEEFDLTIKLDRVNQKIPYISPLTTRELVSFSTNPANDNSDIIQLIHRKLNTYSTILISANLSPSDIMKGY